MNVGSLFSGIGGIELGFEAEGFHTEWFVECDPYAQSILRKHWSDAIIYDDVTQIDWAAVPKVDILTGGFPCQDISNAGKRAGITGSRSSLWKHYCEAIRVLRPKYAVIENVSALTGRGLNVVLADLTALGYDAEWHCIPASAVGANHRRDRLFIISYPNNSGCMDGQVGEFAELRDEQALSLSRARCDVVSDAESGGLEERKTTQTVQLNADGGSIKNGRLLCGKQNGWWASEPELGRVADGVPHRVDRIKCLGNAVVPQVAQVIAQTIREYENRGNVA